VYSISDIFGLPLCQFQSNKTAHPISRLEGSDPSVAGSKCQWSVS
jgi:hypothetical protein